MQVVVDRASFVSLNKILGPLVHAGHRLNLTLKALFKEKIEIPPGRR
jgi:hypothetical protein